MRVNQLFYSDHVRKYFERTSKYKRREKNKIEPEKDRESSKVKKVRMMNCKPVLGIRAFTFLNQVHRRNEHLTLWANAKCICLYTLTELDIDVHSCSLHEVHFYMKTCVLRGSACIGFCCFFALHPLLRGSTCTIKKDKESRETFQYFTYLCLSDSPEQM